MKWSISLQLGDLAINIDLLKSFSNCYVTSESFSNELHFDIFFSNHYATFKSYSNKIRFQESFSNYY